MALALDDSSTLFWLVGGTIAVVAILASTFSSVLKTRSREMSRREIAAYIAEGSMTAEQGERLMKASPDDDDE